MTCQRVTETAKLHAYHFTVVKELKVTEKTGIRSTIPRVHDGILNIAWFTDEAWFHLLGYVNSQNMQIWGSNNPSAIHEQQ